MSWAFFALAAIFGAWFMFSASYEGEGRGWLVVVMLLLLLRGLLPLACVAAAVILHLR
jgi:hypothetical protein